MGKIRLKVRMTIGIRYASKPLTPMPPRETKIAKSGAVGRSNDTISVPSPVNDNPWSMDLYTPFFLICLCRAHRQQRLVWVALL